VRLDQLQTHGDSRGQFVELFRAAAYPEPFVQSNHSRSIAGVLRGLHYHAHQADLWYVVSGRIQVGLADLRSPSDEPSTAVVELDGDLPATLYVPEGVAHGFLALTDVDLIYLVTNTYDASDENAIIWDDPMLAIPWKTHSPILSERDNSNPRLDWNLVPRFS
jgi:dTDP-4-dehydrorhamnose 3,5-epimerase